jgi:hypothetical protein
MKAPELVKMSPVDTHPLAEGFEEKISLIVRYVSLAGHLQGSGLFEVMGTFDVVNASIILVCSSKEPGEPN